VIPTAVLLGLGLAAAALITLAGGIALALDYRRVASKLAVSSERSARGRLRFLRRDPSVRSAMTDDVTPIQLPIFMSPPGCMTFFSVAEAEGNIEPPDADESRLYDAAGRLLKAIPDNEGYFVHVVPAESDPSHAEELRDVLRRNLRSILGGSWARRAHLAGTWRSRTNGWPPPRWGVSGKGTGGRGEVAQSPHLAPPDCISHGQTAP